jgi:Na+-driven multidrug efflux pump
MVKHCGIIPNPGEANLMTFLREGTLINKKFYHFLISAILSNVAISLNEFVDSILVSQLLGSEALSMVNIGFPVMLAFAVLYTMMGVGGAISYAGYAGKQEGEKTERVFTSVCLLSFLVSIVFCTLGIIFTHPIASMLCQDETLLSEFEPYLFVLFVSGLLIIPLQVVITLLPALGKPGSGSIINIAANLLNLLMDYVYIRFFSTGLKGAAYATLTGYIAGAVLLLVLVLTKYVSLPLKTIRKENILKIHEVLSGGAGPAINQLGVCIKVAFCNALAMSLAGLTGVSVFSLCMQLISIMYILNGCISNAMVPIAGVLKGQGDEKGVRLLMETVMKTQFAANMIMVVIFEAFPQIIMTAYNIHGDLTEPATVGIRIFSIMFVFRGFVFVFIYYFQVISKKLYATIISLLDGFAGLIPLMLILTHFMGINGIWISFPLLSALMLIGIMVTNKIMALMSQGKYSGFLLIEYEDENIPLYDATIPLTESDIVLNASRLEDFCQAHLKDPYSTLVAVASEEIGICCLQCKDKHMLDKIDILVKLFPDNAVMDIRCIGTPFDVMSLEDESFSNIDVLRKISSSIEYSYVTGMNQTRVKIDLK